MSEVIGKIISESELKIRIKELGEKITADYKNKDLILISILKGSVIFLADLMREINLPYSIDFMAVSSYKSETKSTGKVTINLDINNDIQNMDVLIIEDIIDSGLTLEYVIELLRTRTSKSVEVCALLNKKDCNKSSITPKYNGFFIPPDFVVGYGLDYAEKYRGLPYVGRFLEESVSK